MISILYPNQPGQHTWLPILIDGLKKNEDGLGMSTELVIDKILRHEYVVFNVNDELQVIGYTYNHGIRRVLYLFWMEGKNLKKIFIR